MNFGSQRRPDPSIDVTPMIDVVFQLLLFFMLTTTFVSTTGLDVDLPRASSEVLISDNEDLEIWMKDRSVYVNEQPMTTEQLTELFARRAKANSKTTVVIKADQSVPHGRVVAVMDLARRHGLSRLAIATEVDQE